MPLDRRADYVIAIAVMTVKTKSISAEKKVSRQTRKGRPAQFYASEEFFAMIEEWRANQRPVPTMSEAIRRLVELGLSSKERGKK